MTRKNNSRRKEAAKARKNNNGSPGSPTIRIAVKNALDKDGFPNTTRKELISFDRDAVNEGRTDPSRASSENVFFKKGRLSKKSKRSQGATGYHNLVPAESSAESSTDLKLVESSENSTLVESSKGPTTVQNSNGSTTVKGSEVSTPPTPEVKHSRDPVPSPTKGPINVERSKGATNVESSKISTSVKGSKVLALVEDNKVLTIPKPEIMLGGDSVKHSGDPVPSQTKGPTPAKISKGSTAVKRSKSPTTKESRQVSSLVKCRKVPSLVEGDKVPTPPTPEIKCGSDPDPTPSKAPTYVKRGKGPSTVESRKVPTIAKVNKVLQAPTPEKKRGPDPDPSRTKGPTAVGSIKGPTPVDSNKGPTPEKSNKGPTPVEIIKGPAPPVPERKRGNDRAPVPTKAGSVPVPGKKVPRKKKAPMPTPPKIMGVFADADRLSLPPKDEECTSLKQTRKSWKLSSSIGNSSSDGDCPEFKLSPEALLSKHSADMIAKSQSCHARWPVLAAISVDAVNVPGKYAKHLAPSSAQVKRNFKRRNAESKKKDADALIDGSDFRPEQPQQPYPLRVAPNHAWAWGFVWDTDVSTKESKANRWVSMPVR